MTQLYNLVRMTTATTGTGTITLGSAVPGYRTFAQANVLNGIPVPYGIRDGSQSEYGIGVYSTTGPTLTRSVIASTETPDFIDPINLSGDAEVFITVGAEDLGRANRTVSLANFDTPVTTDVYGEASTGFEQVFLMEADAEIILENEIFTESVNSVEMLVVILQDSVGGHTPTFLNEDDVPMIELNTFPTWASRPANGIDYISVGISTYGQRGNDVTDYFVFGAHLFSTTITTP